jgi:uncharacterized damage-inducible protein DinB
MENSWNTVLWSQFGAAIDMLEQAIVVCPTELWEKRLWRQQSEQPFPEGFPSVFAQFWYMAYHTLVWLDLYLSGSPEEEFVPLVPFITASLDSEETEPAQPHTKKELLAYLAATRQQCRNTLLALTDEQAGRPVEYPWSDGQIISYLELQIYSVRHVQEHAAQLSLFLGQHAIPDEALDWVPRARGEASGQL